MVFYFVQRGETLYAIARRYQTTVHAIVAANRLEDPNAICPGQALIIPRPGEVPSPPPGGIVHLVRPGETVFRLALKFGTSAPDILRANQIAHPEFILPGQQLVIPEPAEVGDDWPMFGRTPGRSGATPVVLNGFPLPGWTYAPRKCHGVRPSAPVIRYERIYAGLGDGCYYSLERTSGRVKWRIPAGGANAATALGTLSMATPAVCEGLAYLCCPDGTIYAVDAYTGHHIWKLKTEAPITSSPTVSGGVVYLGSWDEHLYALEAKTGAIAWKRRLGARVLLPAAAGDDHVYAMTEKGELWALDSQTGEPLWVVPANAEDAPIFAEVLLVAGGTAYDLATGQGVWHVEGTEGTPVSHVDQILYQHGAVDLFSGTRRWATGLECGPTAGPDSTAVSQPCVPRAPFRAHVATGTLVLGVGADQRVYAWDVTTGATVWSVDLPFPCAQPPAISVNQIVLSLEDGTLATFRMKQERP